jgi:hypothetical protein
MGDHGSFTMRDEANAITAYAFRNGFLETLHAGEHSALVGSDRYSRITDSEMKRLMVEASAKVEELLRMAQEEPERYRQFTREYGQAYCTGWER